MFSSFNLLSGLEVCFVIMLFYFGVNQGSWVETCGSRFGKYSRKMSIKSREITNQNSLLQFMELAIWERLKLWSVCLNACRSVRRPILLNFHSLVCVYVRLRVCLHLPVFVFILQFNWVYLSVRLFVYLYICLFVCLYVCLYESKSKDSNKTSKICKNLSIN